MRGVCKDGTVHLEIEGRLRDTEILCESVRDDTALAAANPALSAIAQALDLGQGLEGVFAARAALTDWEDILTIAAQVVLGFPPAQDADESEALKKMGQQLTQIQRSLDALENKIDDVIALLKDLPEVIAGIVNEQWIRNRVSDANARVQAIQAKCLNLETFVANKRGIDELLDELMVDIRGVWTNCGSDTVQASILTASALSCWAQVKGRVLADHHEPDLNPTNLTLRDLPFFLTIDDTFIKFEQAAEVAFKTASEFYDSVPHGSAPPPPPEIPPPGYQPPVLPRREFDQKTGSFRHVSHPWGQHYCSYDTTETLFGRALVGSGFTPFETKYFPVDTAGASWLNEANVEAARRAWPRCLRLRREAIATLKLLANRKKAFQLISEALDATGKPARRRSRRKKT